MRYMKDILTFVKENLDLIQEDNWEFFYNKALQGNSVSNFINIGQLTSTLLSVGIYPLKNLNYIPSQFLQNTDLRVPLNLYEDQILTIKEDAFFNTTGLKKLNIPEGVTTLEDCSILHCRELKEVILPSTLKSIGRFCFNNCPVENFYFNGTTEQWKQVKLIKSNDTFYKTNTRKIICKDGKIALRH